MTEIAINHSFHTIGRPMPMLDIAPYLLRQIQSSAELLMERKQTESGRAA
jgi:hypothetical protein